MNLSHWFFFYLPPSFSSTNVYLSSDPILGNYKNFTSRQLETTHFIVLPSGVNIISMWPQRPLGVCFFITIQKDEYSLLLRNSGEFLTKWVGVLRRPQCGHLSFFTPCVQVGKLFKGQFPDCSWNIATCSHFSSPSKVSAMCFCAVLYEFWQMPQNDPLDVKSTSLYPWTPWIHGSKIKMMVVLASLSAFSFSLIPLWPGYSDIH